MGWLAARVSPPIPTGEGKEGDGVEGRFMIHPPFSAFPRFHRAGRTSSPREVQREPHHQRNPLIFLRRLAPRDPPKRYGTTPDDNRRARSLTFCFLAISAFALALSCPPFGGMDGRAAELRDLVWQKG